MTYTRTYGFFYSVPFLWHGPTPLFPTSPWEGRQNTPVISCHQLHSQRLKSVSKFITSLEPGQWLGPTRNQDKVSYTGFMRVEYLNKQLHDESISRLWIEVPQRRRMVIVVVEIQVDSDGSKRRISGKKWNPSGSSLVFNLTNSVDKDRTKTSLLDRWLWVGTSFPSVLRVTVKRPQYLNVYF